MFKHPNAPSLFNSERSKLLSLFNFSLFRALSSLFLAQELQLDRIVVNALPPMCKPTPCFHCFSLGFEHSFSHLHFILVCLNKKLPAERVIWPMVFLPTANDRLRKARKSKSAEEIKPATQRHSTQHTTAETTTPRTGNSRKQTCMGRSVQRKRSPLAVPPIFCGRHWSMRDSGPGLEVVLAPNSHDHIMFLRCVSLTSSLHHCTS